MRTKREFYKSLLVLLVLFFMLLLVGSIYLRYVKSILSSEVEQLKLEISAKDSSDMEAQIVERMYVIERIVLIVSVLCAFVLFLGIISIVVKNYMQNNKLYQLAYVDSLTGLPTKAKHKENIQKILEKKESKYAYVSLVIDNFTFINEMFGYEYGNHVLKSVASNIKEWILEEEDFSRIVGASFGILMFYEDERSFHARLSYIMKKASDIPNEDANNLHKITFSCGVYAVGEEKAVHVLRKNASIARESFLHPFENSIEYYNQNLHNTRMEAKELEYDLQTSIDNGELSVYLQPKYRMQDERIVGAEALARWKHPKKGFISPDVFIPISESNLFVVKIDMFVLEEVCKLIRSWRDMGREALTVSVNLSRIHLKEPDMVQKISKVVDQYEIPHNRIEFELTETAVYEELESLLMIMKRLKEAGYLLSMDDFGSGFSSLNMLKQLPVDILKLDKAFLGTFENDTNETRDKKIVSHVISMAKDLEMEVLAEGVETKGQKDFLKEASCDMVQGYYYAKPMSIEDFTNMTS